MTKGPFYFRRRGAQESATADLRFRRAETLRIEIPARSDAGARLLDRTGAAINVPVASTSRVEDDGSQWTTVRPPLASRLAITDIDDGCAKAGGLNDST